LVGNERASEEEEKEEEEEEEEGWLGPRHWRWTNTDEYVWDRGWYKAM
jgi:hypothetical protein